MRRDWSYPLLVLLASRGGCLERGVLAALLWVKPLTVRRMSWGLRRRGLVSVEGERLCVTRRGLEHVGWVEFLARKRNHYLVYGRGVAVLVSYRNRGATVYVAGLDVLCRLMAAGAVSRAAVGSVARAVGLASKTVSYGLKMLELMGCPGVGCPVECGVRDKPPRL
ncbi:MAG: hypothetical protein GXO15_02765 [Crenarchaeota archaeon]|nr:hypothetical protein [Thermoproteota archaeon]